MSKLYGTLIPFEYVDEAPTIPQNLDDLINVSVGAPQNLSVLRYHSGVGINSAGEWQADLLSYNDLTNKPSLFSGSYNDLTNKPSLFSGSYNDLTNKPAIPSSLNNLSDVSISSPTAGQLLTYTGSAFINSNYIRDNIVIGATSGQNARLGIVGSGTSSGSYTLLLRDSSNDILFYVRNDGLINTGTSTNSPYNNDALVSANLYVTSGGTLQRASSSIKYKRDIIDAPHGLDKVLQLRYVNFKSKKVDAGDKQFGGLIAEEVHDVGLTEFVDYGPDGTPEGVHYGNMVALAFKAIQQLNTKLEALEARIVELENS